MAGVVAGLVVVVVVVVVVVGVTHESKASRGTSRYAKVQCSTLSIAIGLFPQQSFFTSCFVPVQRIVYNGVYDDDHGGGGRCSRRH